MRTWSKEGMRVAKSHLESELATLGFWKEKLTHYEMSADRAKSMVEFLEKNVDERKREIAEQEATK